MANNDNAFGLRPLRYRSGAPYNGAVNPYYIPSGYGVALFVGDPVIITSTSNTAAVTFPGAGTFQIGSLPEINKATVGTTAEITGAIVSFAALPTDLEKKHNAASTERIAWVADDPELVFEIQAEAALAATSISLNANLIFTNSGSTTTGLSGVELDAGTTDTPATTQGFQLQILRVKNTVDENDVALTNSIVEVRINQHSYRSNVAGV